MRYFYLEVNGRYIGKIFCNEADLKDRFICLIEPSGVCFVLAIRKGVKVQS